MDFCPFCANLLQIELAVVGVHGVRFFCPTCPYIYPITRKIAISREPLVKKVWDPIFSGADAMELAPKTAATCPSCHHGEAHFNQVQTRSADEPMTTFYKCCKEGCGHYWRED